MRIKMGKSLGIIPHVRAGTMTTTSVGETSFPTPEVAVLHAQHRRRFEDGQVRRDGIQHIWGQSGREHRVFEGKRAGAKGGVMFIDVECDLSGVVPQRGIIGTPTGRRSLRKGTTTRGPLGLGEPGASNLQITVWKVPRDDDWVGPRFTWSECSRKQNRSAIPP